MKKRKLGLILNICTMCLAITAIVIGVYSLKQADLSINGSLGFTSNGVKANIVTSITGSVANAGDTYSKTAVYQPNGTAGVTVNNDTKEITFTRYFSDKGTINKAPAPIKMTFAITNQSAYAIKVDVVTPTLPTGVQMTTDKSSIKIDKDASGSITATFTLDSTVTDFSAKRLTGFKLELSQYDYSKTNIEVKYDASGLLSNYYIEYGTNVVVGSTKLKWYIIGKYVDEMLTTFTSNDLTTVTANSSYKLKEGITYAFMSSLILPSGDAKTDEKNYIPYNNDLHYDTTNNKFYSNKYTSTIANDYSISTVREYLSGKTVNIATKYGDSVSAYCNDSEPDADYPSYYNFFTQNSLKDSDIYTLIKPRSLLSMSTKMYNLKDDYTVPVNTTEGIASTDADAFWLLSYYEKDNLWSNETNRVGYFPNSSKATCWWLRSQMNEYNSQLAYCDWSGVGLIQPTINTYCAGIRPAFLI